MTKKLTKEDLSRYLISVRNNQRLIADTIQYLCKHRSVEKEKYSKTINLLEKIDKTILEANKLFDQLVQYHN